MPTPNTPDAIDGTWQLIRAEFDGNQAPELVVAKTELTLAHGIYQVHFDGEITDEGTFEPIATAPINSILLHGIKGPNAGRTIPCIYQLAGERLRICYGVGGMPPKEFTTTNGRERYLATYRRKP